MYKLIILMTLICLGGGSVDWCGDVDQDSKGALEYTGTTGIIPAKSISYSNDTKWLIKIPEGNKIHTYFKMIRVTNLGPKQNRCVGRFVLVRSIPCKSNEDVQKFCSNNDMKEWLATSNQLLVSFYLSNSLLQDLNFTMEYKAECGGSFDNIDELFEPFVPSYADNCTWTFTIPRKQQRPALLFQNSSKSLQVVVKNKDGKNTQVRDSDGSWQYPDTDTLTISYVRDTSTSINKDVVLQNVQLQYIANDNPCLELSSPCIHGTCVPKRGVEYNCSCSKGYTGTNCSKLLFEGPVCREEKLSINRASITWEVTMAGEDDTQDCPGGVTGKAVRPCLNDTQSEEGQWGRPDLSGCINQIILDIAEAANSLRSKVTVEKYEIFNITDSIVMATSDGVDGTTTHLYPGDLLKTTETIQTIAEVSKKANVQHNELQEIAQGYGNAVGGVIDRRIAPVWRLIQLNDVESRMADILTSVSTLAGNIANTHMKPHNNRHARELSNFNNNLTIKSTNENLEFSISFHERIAMCDDKAEFSLGQNTSSSITLPPEVFKNAVKSTKDSYIQVYTARFSSMAHILTATQREERRHISENDTKTFRAVINSDIVSSRVLNAPADQFQDLQHNVIIVLELKNLTSSTAFEENCVFMNMTSSSHKNRWSNNGCIQDTSASNDTHVVCLCSHLTNFAVLMDVFEVSAQIGEKNNDVLTYLTYAGCGLSIVCCVIAVVIFHYFRLRIERIKIHEHLAVAIVLVQILFLVGIERTENKYVCMSLAIALHYALTAMFCWMLVEGFHLYVLLVKVFNRGRHFTKYMLIGWGIPVLIIGISAGVFHEDYGNTARCWLSHKLLLIVFVPTVGLVILINSVILIMVLRIMAKSMSTKANAETRSTIRAGLKAAAILLPLLGLTWTLGFLSVDSKDTLVFTYLFTLCNSLQGVFFFIFHCFLSIDVQKAYKRRSQRRSTITWTNFTGSSKRKSFDQDTFYTNSKESINTVTTDTSSMDRRRSLYKNGVDRIYRDQKIVDRFGFSSSKVYHDHLFRSKSDETSNVSKRERLTTPILNDLNGLIFYRGDTKRAVTTSSDVTIPDKEHGANTKEHQRTEHLEVNRKDGPMLLRVNLEDSYIKPIKRDFRMSGKARETLSNHVRFDNDMATPNNLDDEVFQKITHNNEFDPIRTTPKRPVHKHRSSSSASSSSNRHSVSSEDFLRELKEKTASFKEQ